MKHITLLDHIDPIKREFIALLDLMEYPRDSLRWEALFKFGAFLANINPPAMSTQLEEEPKNTPKSGSRVGRTEVSNHDTYKESFGQSLADRAQDEVLATKWRLECSTQGEPDATFYNSNIGPVSRQHVLSSPNVKAWIGSRFLTICTPNP